MRKLVFFFSLTAATIIGCESIVDVKVNQVEPYLVVDAWLTHTPGDQTIRLTTTQPYYENDFAPGVSNAQVTVTDNTGEVFEFIETENGTYTWTSNDAFGQIGRTYFLEIQWDGNTYTASSELKRVPSIDSITYTYEAANSFNPVPFYYAEFFATDPEGEGDVYWLKAWKNGKPLNKPSEIYLFYDASYGEGGGDGIPFIFPLRTSANPIDVDINENMIPPYWPADTFQIEQEDEQLSVKLYKSKGMVENGELVFKVKDKGKKVRGGVESIPLDGNPYSLLGDSLIAKQADSIYLELHAISDEAWFFLTRVLQETARPEGFGALFATPPSNVPTNIQAQDETVNVAGIFNVAAVSSAGRKLTPEAIREQPQ